MSCSEADVRTGPRRGGSGQVRITGGEAAASVPAMDLWDLNAVEVQPRQPVVLHSDEGAARVIAINLPAGEALAEHEVHEHAWLHVERGTVEVTQGESTCRASVGCLVHWVPRERHTVRAVEDARLTLLLAPWPGPRQPKGQHAA